MRHPNIARIYRLAVSALPLAAALLLNPGLAAAAEPVANA